MNSLPRFTTVLVLGSAPFALLDSYGLEPDPFGSGLLVVCGFCFGSVALVCQAHFLTLLIRIRLGDLCLSAHIAPLPVQKKRSASHEESVTFWLKASRLKTLSNNLLS